MNNNGIKVMLVILIVICLFQGCGLASMTEEMNNLNMYISNIENDMGHLKNQIIALENAMKEDSLIMDYSYGIDKVDWEQGVIQVEYQITLRDTSDATKIVINNGNGTYELIASGKDYKGIVSYPIDDRLYETEVQKYNGSVLIDSESIYDIGAGTLLCKYVMCDFYGMSAYGNGRLTLAGNVEYYVNLEEKIKNIKVVGANEEFAVGNVEHGDKEINVSSEFALPEGNKGHAKALCLEVETEEGMIYRAYPNLSLYENYKVNIDEEVMLEADLAGWLEVTTPSGKTYEIELLP